MSTRHLDPISDSAFPAQWEAVRRHAFNAGVADVSRLLKSNSRKEIVAFYSEIHRAYERVQQTVAELLHENSRAIALSAGEQLHRELLWRKLADGIACTMMHGKTHFMRRMVVSETMSKIDFLRVSEYLKRAKELNAESRQTFALVTDLTSFVQLGDILRIDGRRFPPTLSLIELKSGRVNSKLLEIIDDIAPTEESIRAIERDARIPHNEVKQAQRMLRQNLRIEQVTTTLTHDVGVDPQLKLPIRLSKDQFSTVPYDDVLESLILHARQNGAATTAIDQCVFLGVHYSEYGGDLRRASRIAHAARLQHKSENESTYHRIAIKVGADPTDADVCFSTAPYEHGLMSQATRPFPLWRLSEESRADLMTGRACLISTLDIIALGIVLEQVGLDLKLVSRKDSAKFMDVIGGSRMLLYHKKALAYSKGSIESVMLKGTASRFFYELVRPYQYFRDALRNLESAAALTDRDS